MLQEPVCITGSCVCYRNLCVLQEAVCVTGTCVCYRKLYVLQEPVCVTGILRLRDAGDALRVPVPHPYPRL